MGRRRDEDEQAQGGEAASARVEDELREARDEVFRAYVRAREQAHRLGERDAPPRSPHEPER